MKNSLKQLISIWRGQRPSIKFMAYRWSICWRENVPEKSYIVICGKNLMIYDCQIKWNPQKWW
jgi:hypothetical protein